VGLLAAVFAVVHPERFLRDFGEHLDPFRTPVVFAQQADAICADYQRSVSDLRQRSLSDRRLPVGSAKRWQALRRIAANLLAVAEREVAKLHALALPTTNRGLAKAWIAAHDQSVVLLGRFGDALQRKDRGAVMMLAPEFQANGQRVEELALKLGMNACSNM
jgi:hypothetical protein